MTSGAPSLAIPAVNRPSAAGGKRAVRDGLALAGLAFAAILFLVAAPQVGTFGYDAWSYWTVSWPHPYEIPLGGLGSFPYTPPIAFLFQVAGLVPWWVFLFAWTCLGVGTVVWLGGRWSPFLFAFPPLAIELYHGNIHLLLAAAIALGFRHPSSWAFVLLAKPTMGIGLLWFAVRREWRPLTVSLGLAVAIAAISAALWPGVWVEWIAYASANAAGMPGGPTIGVPLWLRIAIAAAVVVWGARTDRPWTVAVAATIALPVLWYAGFAVLLAAVPGLRHRTQRPSGRP